MSLNERIVINRKLNNLSQEELASKMNISRQAVSKWERGITTPDVDNLVTLSSIFNVSVDELLKGEQPETEKVYYNKIGNHLKIYGIAFLLLSLILSVFGFFIHFAFLGIAYLLFLVGLTLLLCRKNYLLFFGWALWVSLVLIFNPFWTSNPTIWMNFRYLITNGLTFTSLISLGRGILFLILLGASFYNFKKRKQ